MMAERGFETNLYYQLSLDRLVPEDHLLRGAWLRRLASPWSGAFVVLLQSHRSAFRGPVCHLRNAAGRLPLRHRFREAFWLGK